MYTNDIKGFSDQLYSLYPPITGSADYIGCSGVQITQS